MLARLERIILTKSKQDHERVLERRNPNRLTNGGFYLAESTMTLAHNDTYL